MRAILASLALGLAACAGPKAYPGPELPRESRAEVGGARARDQRVQIDEIDGKSRLEGWSGGAPVAQLLPGVHEFRVRKIMSGRGIAGLSRWLGGDGEQESRVLRMTLAADWSYWIFYDWPHASFSVLREPAVAKPRGFSRIDAPRAAVACAPEPGAGEAAVLLCAFPDAPGPGCYRAVAEASSRGGYDRLELRVRGSDDASAGRAAERQARERLEAKRPGQDGSAEIHVLEIERLAAAEPCD